MHLNQIYNLMDMISFQIINSLNLTIFNKNNYNDFGNKIVCLDIQHICIDYYLTLNITLQGFSSFS